MFLFQWIGSIISFLIVAILLLIVLMRVSKFDLGSILQRGGIGQPAKPSTQVLPAPSSGVPSVPGQQTVRPGSPAPGSFQPKTSQQAFDTLPNQAASPQPTSSAASPSPSAADMMELQRQREQQAEQLAQQQAQQPAPASPTGNFNQANPPKQIGVTASPNNQMEQTKQGVSALW